MIQPFRFRFGHWFAFVLLSTVFLPLSLSGGSLSGGSAAVAQATTQIALTSQEQAALRQGRILLSGEDGNYTARVMVNGSAETAWAVLTDYNNFANFFPSVESSQLLSSDQNQKVFEQVNVVRIFPITRRARVVIAASETYPSNISFRLVEGDLEGLQGAWYVTGAGNQVMITHQVIVDPGRSNRSLFFNIYKDNLQKTMAALKQEIERRSGR
jgi:ribosome-associated toxin RatA of RatAB toxin-antitoxin module